MIRGDAMVGIEQMGQLKGVIRKLLELPRRTAEEAKPEIDAALREQFRAGTDPYGRSWAPVKPSTIARRLMSKSSTPLTDTRKLGDGTSVQLQGGTRAGLLIKVGAPYGYFHQVGFRVGRTAVPARRVLPEYGLPALWRRILDRAASRAARKLVGRA